ncbi:hypothetical protein M0805_006981 [Coniferiporia weirii]|nr:hypothetical protein M0805_006981 [Coniferiporia weirii]
MATLVATSPPPMAMRMDVDVGRSVFAQGHAPPSPAYSPPQPQPHPLPGNVEDPAAVATSLPPITSAPAIAQAPVPAHTSTLTPAPTPTLFNHTDAHTHAPLRPAKDLAAFTSLLPPAVEFVEGSSSGALAVVEGKYEPINASPKAAANGLPSPASNGVVNGVNRNGGSETPSKKHSADEQDARKALYTRQIDFTWPTGPTHGSGLINLGNTCFLNSALQCLLHTPPLLRILLAHKKDDPCRVKNGFCMTCAMRQTMSDSYSKGRAFSPFPITKNLNVIAKHLRRGRQEDSHEFLRYAVDSLQKSCLAGHPPKLDHKIAETTWVHKLFGGRLRSRVTCSQCGHNSDTYDSILDLSIDIYNIGGLKDALKKFTAIDQLKGADKYKCEKCKRPVNAEKRFTIHQAPAVLTVHLKRFTPMGRKLQHPIRYDERLSLQPSMSEGEYGPMYTLYGVISHAGSGPNSGHYFAHVRGADGTWYEMNDDSVERRASATNMKNAYVLFYMREKGQALEAALRADTLIKGVPQKRKGAPGDEEDVGESSKAERPFIGPAIPAHLRTPTDLERAVETPKSNPQSEKLKKKIEAVERGEGKKAQQAAMRTPKPLVDYPDDSEPEEQGEPVERPGAGLTQNNGTKPDVGTEPPSSPSPHALLANGLRKDLDAREGASSPLGPPPTSPLMPSPSPAAAIAPINFYGAPSAGGSDAKGRKRKSPENDEPNVEASNAARRNSYAGPGLNSLRPGLGVKGRSSLGGNASPFSRGRFGNNLGSAGEDRGDRELMRAPRGRQTNTYGRRRILM